MTNLPHNLHPTVRAFLMLNELHRVGFEQLRFESYGGHGTGFIYASRDEAPEHVTHQRFVPAVRYFATLTMLDCDTNENRHLAQKWHDLLNSPTRPNHLAGMFTLDFPDIARQGFGPDGEYREWFRGLVPYLQKGLLPITHRNHSHTDQMPLLAWDSPFGWNDEIIYPAAPRNPHLASQNECLQ